MHRKLYGNRYRGVVVGESARGDFFYPSIGINEVDYNRNTGLYHPRTG